MDWTLEKFAEIIKEWDLSSYEGQMVFSDWLIEQNQIKWANLTRWVPLNPHHVGIDKWTLWWLGSDWETVSIPLSHHGFKLNEIWNTWKAVAKDYGWLIIE